MTPKQRLTRCALYAHHDRCFRDAILRAGLAVFAVEAVLNLARSADDGIPIYWDEPSITKLDKPFAGTRAVCR